MPLFGKPKKTFGREGKPRGSETHGIPVWIPAVITGVVTLSSGFLLAKLGEESTERKTFLELRVKHADEMAKQLAKYVESSRRVKVLCTHRAKEIEEDEKKAREGKVSAEEEAENKRIATLRQEELVRISTAERRPARDALHAELGALKIYFGESTKSRINSFDQWDSGQAYAKCNELADESEWVRQRDVLLAEIRQEFAQARRWWNF